MGYRIMHPLKQGLNERLERGERCPFGAFFRSSEMRRSDFGTENNLCDRLGIGELRPPVKLVRKNLPQFRGNYSLRRR